MRMNSYSMTHQIAELGKVRTLGRPSWRLDWPVAHLNVPKGSKPPEITSGAAGMGIAAVDRMRRRAPNLVFTVQELQAVREHYELRILDEEVRRVQLETQLKLALARLQEMADTLKGTH